MQTSVFYLGIDGGGTKTEAVIVNQDAVVLGRGKADGSNLHNFPIDSAMEHIRQATNSAIANMIQNHHPSSSLTFRTTCLGLSGIDTPDDRQKLKKYFSDNPSLHWPFRTQKLLITNDGLIGLKSATDNHWGVSLISSTGSNCYGINEAYIAASAGDWGHLLGDQGSSYAIGLKMIRIVMKEFDGRRSQTVLTEKVLSHLKLPTVSDLIAFAYHGQPPVKSIASLTHLYADPDLTSNEDLMRMIRSCGQELTLAYQAVINRIELTDKNFPVVLIGGLFNLTKQLTEIVSTRITEITPNARVILPTQLPAQGAAKLAIQSDSASVYPDSILSVITD